MIKTIKQVYCDRCGAEIPRKYSYSNIFRSYSLNIKFQKIKFTAIPKRYFNNSDEIEERYLDEHFDLCPECAKDFCFWWELKKEK